MSRVDAIGQPIEAGDTVLTTVSGYRSRRGDLVKRTIVSFKPKMVEIRRGDEEFTSLVNPSMIVKIPDVNMTNVEYEYGIGLKTYDENADGPHRGNMTYEQAAEWIDDCANDAPPGNTIREVFYVIRRPYGKWVRV